MTGYALREAIRDVLGHFWSESFGQIYPTLAELERQGHVSRPARRGRAVHLRDHRFRAAACGAARQPIQADPPRNGLMLRLFFGRQLGRSPARSLVVGIAVPPRSSSWRPTSGSSRSSRAIPATPTIVRTGC